MENLELRMYGLVPYNISPIQQGIQFGHAKDEYTLAMFEILDEKEKYDSESLKLVAQYRDWLKNWKTYIILNGGTTNLNSEKPGTLNQHLQTLKDKGVFCASFHEPDLGDQLTGVDFLIDERVFNKEKYPDFAFTNQNQKTPGYKQQFTRFRGGMWSNDPLKPEFLNENEAKRWQEWVQSIGGETNLWLRFWLKNFRLA
jgi:hypothetical protein